MAKLWRPVYTMRGLVLFRPPGGHRSKRSWTGFAAGGLFGAWTARNWWEERGKHLAQEADTEVIVELEGKTSCSGVYIKRLKTINVLFENPCAIYDLIKSTTPARHLAVWSEFDSRQHRTCP